MRVVVQELGKFTSTDIIVHTYLQMLDKFHTGTDVYTDCAFIGFGFDTIEYLIIQIETELWTCCQIYT